MSDNKALLQRWFDEVWNQGRAEAIDELMSCDCIAHGLVDAEGKTVCGSEAFKTFHQGFRAAFPDITVTLEDLIQEGDLVMARCIVRGTHRGDSLGFPATHKPFEITGMTMGRWRDGQIVEGWNNFDFLSLHQQLGRL